MALIVEDGTGLTAADSYNSIEELDAYMLRFGYSDWPVSEETPEPEPEPEITEEGSESGSGSELDTEQQAILQKKEAAARRAAVYLDSKYAMRFSGVPVNPDQALAWPRYDAVDYYGRSIPANIVPNAIKQAHAEVARLAYNNTQLVAETMAGPLLKRKKIDVLEWEYDIDSYTNDPVFGWIDHILLPLLGPAEQIGALDVIGLERS